MPTANPPPTCCPRGAAGTLVGSGSRTSDGTAPPPPPPTPALFPVRLPVGTAVAEAAVEEKKKADERKKLEAYRAEVLAKKKALEEAKARSAKK